MLFYLFYFLYNYFCFKLNNVMILHGDWGLGIGDWGLGIGPNPQSPIPSIISLHYLI